MRELQGALAAKHLKVQHRSRTYSSRMNQIEDCNADGCFSKVSVVVKEKKKLGIEDVPVRTEKKEVGRTLALVTWKWSEVRK